MRLINADELKAEFTGDSGQEQWHYTGIRAMIDCAPTIEAEPVVHGKWINTNPPSRSDNIVCSACNYDSIAKFNYCPKCGSKMDMRGDQDE